MNSLIIYSKKDILFLFLNKKIFLNKNIIFSVLYLSEFDLIEFIINKHFLFYIKKNFILKKRINFILKKKNSFFIFYFAKKFFSYKNYFEIDYVILTIVLLKISMFNIINIFSFFKLSFI